MDTFSLCLAFGPLSIYLLLIGFVNHSPRPLVVSGTRESLALGLALMGLVIVGPMHLFLPEEAATEFGGLVWVLLSCLYLLGLVLWVIATPPRLVVYNVTPETLQPLVDEAARQIDPESRWAGRTLAMPAARVNLRLESFPPLYNVSLVSNGYEQSAAAWRRLASELQNRLRTVTSTNRVHGVWLALAGLLILMTLIIRVVHDPDQIAQGFNRMLNP